MSWFLKVPQLGKGNYLSNSKEKLDDDHYWSLKFYIDLASILGTGKNIESVCREGLKFKA